MPLGGDDAPAAWLLDPDKGPQELAEEAEQRDRVWAALAKLPPAQRAAVVRRYYLGMGEAEMARDAAGDDRVEAARRPQGPLQGATSVVPLAGRACHRGADIGTNAIRAPDPQRPGRRQGP